MPTQYKVKIVYEGGIKEVFTILANEAFDWQGEPHTIRGAERMSLLNLISFVKRWLQRNGGKKIEVEEEEVT